MPTGMFAPEAPATAEEGSCVFFLETGLWYEGNYAHGGLSHWCEFH